MSYFEDLNPAFVPEFRRYYRTPSLANALKLLDKLDIHLPYSSFHSAAPSAPSAPSRRGGSPGAGAGADADPFKLHAAVDLLHDLRADHQQIMNTVMDAVLPKDTPARLFTKIKRLNFENARSTEFTWNMSRELARHFGLSEYLYKCKTNVEKRIMDSALYDIVTNWTTRPKTEIILDGVLKAPTGTNPAMEMRTMTVYAFLMVLIDTYNPEQTTPEVNELVFLSGAFQVLDIPEYNQFITRWIVYLVRDSKFVNLSDRVTLEILGDESLPPPYDSTIFVQSGAGALVVNERTVPFHFNLERLMKRLSRKTDLPFELLKEYSQHLYVSYPKYFLNNIFTQYAQLTEDQRKDPDIQRFIETVVKVNAFRDAYKADVAIQRGAVYITGDRLAQMYYALRAREQKAAHRGIWLNPTGIGKFSAMLYTPTAYKSSKNKRIRMSAT
jgi:hypothetical protein